MNTITLNCGVKLKYSTFAKFEVAKNILRDHNVHFVCYYDRHGDSHVCTFDVRKNRLHCVGKETKISANNNDMHRLAGGMVKEERWDEFCGWSL